MECLHSLSINLWLEEKLLSLPPFLHVVLGREWDKVIHMPIWKGKNWETHSTHPWWWWSPGMGVMWWPCPRCKSKFWLHPSYHTLPCPLLSVVHLCPLSSSSTVILHGQPIGTYGILRELILFGEDCMAFEAHFLLEQVWRLQNCFKALTVKAFKSRLIFSLTIFLIP